MSFACLPLTLTPLFNQKGSQFCCLFFFSFTPLSWENLPELIHRSQHMNFQSGISRIFQCGSSFVNLASVACVVGKENVNRIWSLGQGIASLISKKDFKNRAHLACSMSVMFLWFWSASSTSDHQKSLSRHMPLSCTLSTWTKKVKEMETIWFERSGKGKNTTAPTSEWGKAFCSLLSWWVWHPNPHPLYLHLLVLLPPLFCHHCPLCWRPVFADLDANPSLPCWRLR